MNDHFVEVHRLIYSLRRLKAIKRRIKRDIRPFHIAGGVFQEIIDDHLKGSVHELFSEIEGAVYGIVDPTVTYLGMRRHCQRLATCCDTLTRIADRQRCPGLGRASKMLWMRINRISRAVASYEK
ncbi:MAG: hypothetical protein HY548_08310 [Elusimicrobia bacterium]|nr:hypothetical protein [Elusimicrobiota bacterium]